MKTLRQGHTLQGGKYTIVRELGEGTFGITYLAQMQVTVGGQLGNMNTHVNVAIKEFFMSTINTRKEGSALIEGCDIEEFRYYRRKFRAEAENLSRLEHPGIIKALDVFDENNTTYYTMNYIEGQNLDEYICQKNGLPVNEAMDIIRQVADSLGYMHKNKMLHLDVKPKNVMVDNNGKAYLIDFGLAKQYADDGRPESSINLGLGTQGYAPLEQADYQQDGSFPATIDIYALGATLYKVLTGKTPPNPSDVLNKGLDRQPMVTHGVPNWLQDAVEKTMSPEKDRRPQTVEEFKATIGVAPKNAVRPITRQMSYNEETVIDKLPLESIQSNQISVRTNETGLKSEQTMPKPPKEKAPNYNYTTQNVSKAGKVNVDSELSPNIISYAWFSGFVLSVIILIIFSFTGEINSTAEYLWYYLGCLVAFVPTSIGAYIEYGLFYNKSEWCELDSWTVDWNFEETVITKFINAIIGCGAVIALIGIIYYGGTIPNDGPMDSSIVPIATMAIFFTFWHGVFVLLRLAREYLGHIFAILIWIVGFSLLISALVWFFF